MIHQNSREEGKPDVIVSRQRQDENTLMMVRDIDRVFWYFSDTFNQIAVPQIRRSKMDNLGIICHITPLKRML